MQGRTARLFQHKAVALKLKSPSRRMRPNSAHMALRSTRKVIGQLLAVKRNGKTSPARLFGLFRKVIQQFCRVVRCEGSPAFAPAHGFLRKYGKQALQQPGVQPAGSHAGGRKQAACIQQQGHAFPAGHSVVAHGLFPHRIGLAKQLARAYFGQQAAVAPVVLPLNMHLPAQKHPHAGNALPCVKDGLALAIAALLGDQGRQRLKSCGAESPANSAVFCNTGRYSSIFSPLFVGFQQYFPV